MLNEKTRDYLIIGIALAITFILVGSKVKALLTKKAVTETETEAPTKEMTL